MLSLSVTVLGIAVAAGLVLTVFYIVILANNILGERFERTVHGSPEKRRHLPPWRRTPGRMVVHSPYLAATVLPLL